MSHSFARQRAEDLMLPLIGTSRHLETTELVMKMEEMAYFLARRNRVAEATNIFIAVPELEKSNPGNVQEAQ